MAEPEGGEHAGTYGTPAHSIPMVSGDPIQSVHT